MRPLRLLLPSLAIALFPSLALAQTPAPYAATSRCTERQRASAAGDQSSSTARPTGGRPKSGVAVSPLLLQSPSLSATQIAFAYGGDIWTVPRAGGVAHRLVTGFGLESGPIFSPDGSRIAFSGDYDGNTDVYVVPAAGGLPRRLTYHPAPDIAVGWTPDGKAVLFRSNRANTNDGDRLFTVPVSSGLPTVLPLPLAEFGSYSPDGGSLAYVPNSKWEPFWQGYRGGQTTPIWIARLSDSSIVKIPRPNMSEPEGAAGAGGRQLPGSEVRSPSDQRERPGQKAASRSNDSNPMWVGNTIYFLSDRNGPVGLFAYDVATRKVRQVVSTAGQFDILSASAGPPGKNAAIVYSQFGQIHVYNLAHHRNRVVHITVAADLPQLRPHWLAIQPAAIRHVSLSPTGVRMLMQAHGEILTLPAEHGSMINLTQSPGVMDRTPAWSPDGKWIAWFSDRNAGYNLRVRDQRGLQPARTFPLDLPNKYFYDLSWSPNGQYVVFSDQALNLYTLDVAAGPGAKPVKIDHDLYETPEHQFDPAWSPDSRWIAYTKQLPNHLRAVFIYSLADHSIHEVTDGMSDCLYPQFSRDGKYLYFTASTNVGLTAGWLDMSSLDHPVTRSVYVAVLRNDLPSPFPPRTADEPADGRSADTGFSGPRAGASKSGTRGARVPALLQPGPAAALGPAPIDVRIDFPGILQRTLTVPVPAANYVGLTAAPGGALFLVSRPVVNVGARPTLTVARFELATRKTTTLVSGVSDATVSYNGKQLLYARADHWYRAPADKRALAGRGRMPIQNLQVYVNPRAEWAEMYREVWRIQRAFFYDPHYHGLDVAAAEKEFAHYLPGIASRDELTLLFQEMLSFESTGHMFVRGGAMPRMGNEHIGLLGADYRVANGRYQFARIYSGENWNPRLQAPLTQPGVNVHVGDYLLAVNGRPLTATRGGARQSMENIYKAFQQTAGKQTTIEVGPNPDGTSAREVVVKPIANEHALRNMDWIEHNRRLVDRLSHGRLAYVYLPDTGNGGFTNFNRYYFSQVGKQGAILDERFNHGGDLSDYIINVLRRVPMSLDITRHGAMYADPQEAIFGPKVMLINQFAGSGGDALPWYFRKAHVGALVGVRTWGGLVGIGGYPVLMDGGTVTAPRWAISGLHGHWDVEDHGIAPDVTVWQNPALMRNGADPQLEAAVKIAMRQLAAHPLPTYKAPPYPNHHPVLPPIPH